jgi:hypothetical protein
MTTPGAVSRSEQGKLRTVSMWSTPALLRESAASTSPSLIRMPTQ